jgi:transcriptional regulator with XRE-family HTH domain
MGNKLRELRRMKGMTQEALSKFSGVNRVSIAKYESGKTVPSMQTAKKLADALGVTVDELIGG